jgi:putative glutathione S-transferase
VLSASPGRYFLYGGITCPFTHRALLARALRGLAPAIPTVLARPVPGPNGWEFDAPGGAHADPVLGARCLRDIYQRDDPAFAGKASVPVLWDRDEDRIVSNDSGAIALLFNDHLCTSGADLFPPPARERIESDIASFDGDFVVSIIRAGSVQSQADYDQAVRKVFDWLDALDQRLANQRYLGGSSPDLADLVCFTGLVRFDVCYHHGSRCHLRRVQDYPNLWGFVRDFYQLPGVAGTVDLEACHESYYRSRQPDGVIPQMPEIDLGGAGGRQTMAAASS